MVSRFRQSPLLLIWLAARSLQRRGKLITYYSTSGDYHVLLIFAGLSYEATMPTLIVCGRGEADSKTVTALKSSEIKRAFAKARLIAWGHGSPDTQPSR
jgi:hypothetical protein